MQMQKKKTLKEDGRFLIYYHFPQTATAEETSVFEGIEALDSDKSQLSPTNELQTSSAPTEATEKGPNHV